MLFVRNAKIKINSGTSGRNICTSGFFVPFYFSHQRGVLVQIIF